MHLSATAGGNDPLRAVVERLQRLGRQRIDLRHDAAAGRVEEPQHDLVAGAVAGPKPDPEHHHLQSEARRHPAHPAITARASSASKSAAGHA